jgi:hypothetical protein
MSAGSGTKWNTSRGASGRPLSFSINNAGLCHMTRKCLRKCQAASHQPGVNGITEDKPFRGPLHPDYDAACHQTECWPKETT